MARSTTQTRSTTKAKTLTIITVAAAGIAAYAVATLSTETEMPSGVSQQICVAQCGGDSACVNACLPPSGTNLAVLAVDSSEEQRLPDGVVGQAYRQRLAMDKYVEESGTWSVSAGALPAGLTLDPKGLLFGIPSEKRITNFSLSFTLPRIEGVRQEIVGTARVEFRAQQQAGTTVNTDAQTTAMRITTPLSDVRITKDQPYELHLATQGLSDAGELVWSVSYGNLPSGLTLLSREGVILGTPNKVERLNFGITVRGTANANAFASQDGNISVAEAGSVGIETIVGTVAVTAEAFSPEASVLSGGIVGTYASFPFSISGDVARTWSAEGVPAGMTFNPTTHVLSGTPTAAGTSNIIIRAINGNDVKSKTYAWTVAANVAPLQITTTVPEGRAATSYSTQLQATGGSGTRTWRLTSAAQNGWALSPSGVLTGAAPREGVYTFTVRAEDAAASLSREQQIAVNIRAAEATANRTEAVTVATGDVQITTTDLRGEAGLEFDYMLRTNQDSSSYTWTLEPGSARTGWTLYSSGELYAATPAVGTYTFLVKATNLFDTSVSKIQPVTVTIRAAGTPDTSTNTNTNTNTTALAFSGVSSYPEGYVSYSYTSRPFDVVGGSGTYRYSVTAGTLPRGLTLNDAGYIVGVPTQTGTFNFTMTLSDGANTTVRASRSIVIRSAADRTTAINNGGTTGSTSTDAALTTRVAALTAMGVRIHDLVKLQDDGNVNTQEDTTVYYVGSDGRRHAFPNSQVFFTWFVNFNNVRIIGARDLASLPLGANITYRPGVRLVKFVTDPKVYVVDLARRLRAIRSEADAVAIYGSNWANNVDDISDAFYMDYRVDAVITAPASIRPAELTSSVIWPSDVLPQ